MLKEKPFCPLNPDVWQRIELIARYVQTSPLNLLYRLDSDRYQDIINIKLYNRIPEYWVNKIACRYPMFEPKWIETGEGEPMKPPSDRQVIIPLYQKLTADYEDRPAEEYLTLPDTFIREEKIVATRNTYYSAFDDREAGAILILHRDVDVRPSDTHCLLITGNEGRMVYLSSKESDKLVFRDNTGRDVYVPYRKLEEKQIIMFSIYMHINYFMV